MSLDVLLRDLHQIRLKLQAFSTQLQQQKIAALNHAHDEVDEMDIAPQLQLQSQAQHTATGQSHPADIDFQFTVPTLHLYLAQQPAHGELRRLIEVSPCDVVVCFISHAPCAVLLCSMFSVPCPCPCFMFLCRSNSLLFRLALHVLRHPHVQHSHSAICLYWIVVKYNQNLDMC